METFIQAGAEINQNKLLQKQHRQHQFALEKSLDKLKWGIWGYFLLLIFEGGLRKWLLPSLATPLLIIRDPLALWIMFSAYKMGYFVINKLVKSMLVIGSFAFITALLFAHHNLWVALFGARILMIHFPLIFIIGRIFNKSDVIKMGKVLCWIAIPMTFLIAIQFYSPQSAFVNRGVGGDILGAGFSGSMGYLRPSATFSFTNGLTLFYGLTAAYVVFFWLNPNNINKIILISASACIMASIPLSISRGLLFQIGLTGIFAVVAIIRNPKYTGHLVLIGFIGIIALTYLSKQEFYLTATEVFNDRLTTANELEGGIQGVLVDRYLGGLVSALTNSSQQPFFGFGLGMGTNVGSMLLSGSVSFQISEGEWGRLIGEMGPFLGLAVIFIRVVLSGKIAIQAFKKLSSKELLPWLLVSFGFLTVLQAQWAQPTSLGFSTLVGGLMLASLRNPSTQRLKPGL